ncbi:hypothetical protein LF130101_1519 [Limosilactobacillus fermentum]|nr:hypothetical protein LF130101_1519 [Limosilactobacillus fermentum]
MIITLAFVGLLLVGVQWLPVIVTGCLFLFGIGGGYFQPANIIADKAYGTAKLRQYIEDKAGVYTIPPKENTKDKWTCDYHVYCERHLIEGQVQNVGVN